MDEIQRYRIACGVPVPVLPHEEGIWVKDAESEAWHLADKKAALEAQAEEHRKNHIRNDTDWAGRMELLKSKHDAELAALREEGVTERLEYIARDLARLLLVSARDDITEFYMNRSTYAWLVERANA